MNFQGFGGFDANSQNPWSSQGVAGFGQYADQGKLGLDALSGNTDAVQKLMNPYLATQDPIWAKIRSQNLNAVSDRATAAGAFGGSRTGVAEGVANANVGQAQAAQAYQAFNDAMGRAGGLANLGMGANQAILGAGQFQQGMDWNSLLARYNEFLRGQNDPAQKLQMLEGAIGPTGSTQTQQMTSSPWQQLLGLALTAGGAAFGGPAGAAAGSTAAGATAGIGPMYGGYGRGVRP